MLLTLMQEIQLQTWINLQKAPVLFKINRFPELFNNYTPAEIFWGFFHFGWRDQ